MDQAFFKDEGQTKNGQISDAQSKKWRKYKHYDENAACDVRGWII